MTHLSSSISVNSSNENSESMYKPSKSFDVKFDILRYAALQHPNSFTRYDVFEMLPLKISNRTQQRLLESLSHAGYIDKLGDTSTTEYVINTRAFIPFLSLLHSIK
ncbi:hypothetical protein [Psychrobacter sp. AOP31-A1-22]|uniref:hypothetical protein n=1 Tax=Psychrobacter sp. AOP31-A1-22 TaxID=3457696 RepID=UPI0040371DE1